MNSLENVIDPKGFSNRPYFDNIELLLNESFCIICNNYNTIIIIYLSYFMYNPLQILVLCIYTVVCFYLCKRSGAPPQTVHFTICTGRGRGASLSMWPWRHRGFGCRALEPLRSSSVLLEENRSKQHLFASQLWMCLSAVDDVFSAHSKGMNGFFLLNVLKGGQFFFFI